MYKVGTDSFAVDVLRPSSQYGELLVETTKVQNSIVKSPVPKPNAALLANER